MTDQPAAPDGGSATAAQLLADGRIPSVDHLAQVVSSRVTDGPAAGCRAIDVRTYRGFAVRLLPDRGLDVGSVWFGDVPLHWTSAVGEAAPLPNPRDGDWNAAFGGGLITTCGYRNVGAPSEGHGQHGLASHLRARDLQIDRQAPGQPEAVVIRGVMEEVEAIGARLRVERTIRISVGRAQLEISDRTTNLGGQPEPAPLLYHVNLGAPLWADEATLEITSDGVEPRDEASEPIRDGWRAPPAVAPGVDEWVGEHRVRADQQGWASARLRQPREGLDVEVAWDTTGLPRLHQWMHRRAGVYALAVEPANCSVLGRAADRAAGRLPMLAPGAARSTDLRVTAERR